jgi:hypothetical protein
MIIVVSRDLRTSAHRFIKKKGETTADFFRRLHQEKDVGHIGSPVSTIVHYSYDAAFPVLEVRIFPHSSIRCPAPAHTGVYETRGGILVKKITKRHRNLKLLIRMSIPTGASWWP